MGARTLYIEPGSPWENGCEFQREVEGRAAGQRGLLYVAEGTVGLTRIMTVKFFMGKVTVVGSVPVWLAGGDADVFPDCLTCTCGPIMMIGRVIRMRNLDQAGIWSGSP